MSVTKVYSQITEVNTDDLSKDKQDKLSNATLRAFVKTNNAFKKVMNIHLAENKRPKFDEDVG